MKKIFMTLAAVCVAATMNAQVYVGGGLGLASTSQDGDTNTKAQGSCLRLVTTSTIAGLLV